MVEGSAHFLEEEFCLNLNENTDVQSRVDNQNTKPTFPSKNDSRSTNSVGLNLSNEVWSGTVLDRLKMLHLRLKNKSSVFS